MTIVLDQELSVDPNPTRVPGSATLHIRARSLEDDTKVDVLYSIDPQWTVWFEAAGGCTKTLWHRNIQVAFGGSPVATPVKFTAGPGTSDPASGVGFILRARVTDQRDGSACHSNQLVGVIPSVVHIAPLARSALTRTSAFVHPHWVVRLAVPEGRQRKPRPHVAQRSRGKKESRSHKKPSNRPGRNM